MHNKKKFLPFAVPDISIDEIDEVVSSLKSGWITTGPKVKEFEENFKKFLGEDDLYCISVNSATAGLHLALEAIGIKPDDEVIVPSYTFTATAEIVRYFGAHPKIVDIDLETFNMSIDDIKEATTSKTKAIIPVHFAGLSCDMDPIITFARRNNIKIVEDAAHAIPTKYKNNLIGTLGSDVTVFSFYANKNITTGEGGMLVTRDKKIAERAKIMRIHGISRDAFDRFVSKKPAWYYEIVAPGYKYNLTDLAASIGIHQLKRIGSLHKKRLSIARIYDEELKNLPLILPPDDPVPDHHSRHLYPIQIQDKKISRESFIELMFSKGIGCSVHYVPLHLHPYWKNTYKLHKIDYPNSQKIYENQVSLPLHTKMSNSDQEYIITTIKNIFKNVKKSI